MSAKKAPHKASAIPLPAAADWRTTDADEVNRRIQRAREEKPTITNLEPEHPVFSTFRVCSPSGMTYQVEIRDLGDPPAVSCTCPDFRRNGLGTCKHVEAVRIWLKRRLKGSLRQAISAGSQRIDLVPAEDGLAIERNFHRLPISASSLFTDLGRLRPDVDPAVALTKLRRFEKVRVSQDVAGFLEARRHAAERIILRRDYEAGVTTCHHPEHDPRHPP